jgi:hypothetical protein
MTTRSKRWALAAAAVATVFLGTRSVSALDTNAAPERIGVYDSRAIAYADFVSEARMLKIRSMVAAAKQAKSAGATEKFKELSAALKAEQERADLQVFSTAPVEDALAAIKTRVGEVEKEAGVALLVSKWDEKALAERKGARRIDVTAELLRDYKLTEKQLKVVQDLVKHPPLPLDKARKMSAQGKL